MASKKQSKDENNTFIKNLEENSAENSPEESNDFSQFESQFDFEPQTESAPKTNASQQALENIKHIFNKTQTVRKVADVKHQEIQSQFKELRERLNNSSECLQRMKKGIDNIKFSYQNKIFEMHHSLSPPDDYIDAATHPPQTKEEVAKQMEQIRDKIEKIQNNIYTEKEKQEKVMQSYKDAFEHVTAVLESIDKGDYSSINLANVKKNQ